MRKLLVTTLLCLDVQPPCVSPASRARRRGARDLRREPTAAHSHLKQRMCRHHPGATAQIALRTKFDLRLAPRTRSAAHVSFPVRGPSVFVSGDVLRCARRARALFLRRRRSPPIAARNTFYGTIMRPGAPCSPFCVWHALQSPIVCGPTITRSLPLTMTLAVNGKRREPM
jgi:hypothetical protein